MCNQYGSRSSLGFVAPVVVVVEQLVQQSNEVADATDMVETVIDIVDSQQVANSPQPYPPAARMEESKIWIDVIRGNRLPSHGRIIQFFAPTLIDGEVEVEISPDDMKSELYLRQNSLILFAIGENCPFVKQFMTKILNFVSLPKFDHEECYFIACFISIEDMDAVYGHGPYTVYSMPLFMRHWTSNFVLKEDFLRVMPLWVTFPRLPLNLWRDKEFWQNFQLVVKTIDN